MITAHNIKQAPYNHSFHRGCVVIGGEKMRWVAVKGMVYWNIRYAPINFSHGYVKHSQNILKDKQLIINLSHCTEGALKLYK